MVPDNQQGPLTSSLRPGGETPVNTPSPTSTLVGPTLQHHAIQNVDLELPPTHHVGITATRPSGVVQAARNAWRRSQA